MMTDKQTALLLRQIAGRIRALAVDVEPLIESQETVELRDVRMVWGAQPTLESVTETRLAAVQRILDLAEDIADEAELLAPVAEAVPES